jgi:hypothetical protein
MKRMMSALLLSLSACGGAADGSGQSEAVIGNQAATLEKKANDATSATIAQIRTDAARQAPTPEEPPK